MIDEKNCAKVRLEQVGDEKFWQEVDSELAAYQGAVRVVGQNALKPGVGYKAGGYNEAGLDGILHVPKDAIGNDEPVRRPSYWSATWFLFEREDEAQRFATRFDDHVVGTEGLGKDLKADGKI